MRVCNDVKQGFFYMLGAAALVSASFSFPADAIALGNPSTSSEEGVATVETLYSGYPRSEIVFGKSVDFYAESASDHFLVYGEGHGELITLSAAGCDIYVNNGDYNETPGSVGLYNIIYGKATDVNKGAAIQTFQLPNGPFFLVLTNCDGGAYSYSASLAVPMFRLYNPNSGEHFYTKSSVERDNLVTVGWSYEGCGWNAPENSQTPVYRLYNQYAGDHHYTMSSSERDALVRAGWSYEGVGWYSANQAGAPVYRQYNPFATTGTHNYTTSLQENDDLKEAGWVPEGIAWYGVKPTV